MAKSDKKTRGDGIMRDLIARLPIVDPCPFDWLPVKDWSERSGVSPHAIKMAIGKGAVPDRFLCACYLPPTKRRQIAIAWDDFAYEFFINRLPAHRPKDFFENKERLYKPIRKPNPERPLLPPVRTVANPPDDGDEPEQVELDFGNLLDGKMPASQVLDYPAAKFRREQLKILQDQIAVKVATNALVKTEDVGSMLRSLAAEVSGELVKMETHLAPVLAACSDPREVRRLLRDGIETALRPLSGGEI